MQDLAAMMGGGAAAPIPPMPGGEEEMLAALMGGGDPSVLAQPTPAGPMYPSTDPAAVGAMLQQIMDAQQADHAALAADQSEALLGNPMFEALMSGAPMGPGAGQDMQGIGPMGDIAPEMMA